MKKKPIIITVLAILILLSIPGDLFNVITLNKNKYQEDVKDAELLIKNGIFNRQGKTIYWKDKNDFQKRMIISQLNVQRKILSKFFIFRTFKGLFVILNLFLFYALWNMKKWIFIILIINVFFAVLFNVIVSFLPLMPFLLFLVSYVIVLVLVSLSYRKYFVY